MEETGGKSGGLSPATSNLNEVPREVAGAAHRNVPPRLPQKGQAGTAQVAVAPDASTDVL